MVEEKKISLNVDGITPRITLPLPVSSDHTMLKLQPSVDLGALAKDQLLMEQVHDARHNRNQREKYAKYVFSLMAFWLIFVAIVVGARTFSEQVYISEHVLLMLLGTTSLNIIGLFLVILKFLFPTRDKKR